MKNNIKASKQSTPVFKSKEGRLKILAYYDRLLEQCSFAYLEHSVETSFGSTYLLESGEKNPPPIFLLHGSTANSSAWFGDIKDLSQHFHVFAVDLIGDAGHSAESRLNMKTDDYAIWIKELLEKTGVEKASFMGNSLGAWMCLKFASTFPENVDKLVLIAAAGIAPIRISFVFQLILFGLRGKKGSDAIMKMVFGKDEFPQEVLDYTNLIAANYSPYTGEIPVLSDEQLARLRMPILYIAGEHDKLTNVPKCVKKINRLIPHAIIHIFKDSGHVIINALDVALLFLLKKID